MCVISVWWFWLAHTTDDGITEKDGVGMAERTICGERFSVENGSLVLFLGGKGWAEKDAVLEDVVCSSYLMFAPWRPPSSNFINHSIRRHSLQPYLPWSSQSSNK